MKKTDKKNSLKNILSETLTEISQSRKDTFHEVLSEIIPDSSDDGEAFNEPASGKIPLGRIKNLRNS